jgi:hypothetical protein
MQHQTALLFNEVIGPSAISRQDGFQMFWKLTTTIVSE